MQQSTLRSLQRAVIEIHPQPRQRICVIDLISRGLDRLDLLALSFLRAIGGAFVDGIIAHSFGMYGLPRPHELGLPASPPFRTVPQIHYQQDVAEAPFQDVDEFFAWLDAQSDRIHVYR